MSQLMLVIVVVVAGIVLAAVVSLRAGKISQRAGAASGPQADAALTPAPPPPAPSAATSFPDPASTGTMSFSASDLDFGLVAPAADGAPSAVDAKQPTHAPPEVVAPATPAARAAVLAGNTPPEGPQILRHAEIFARLFELALGVARPASSVTVGHKEVVEATRFTLQEADTQQRYMPRRPNMLPRVLSASSDDSFSRRDLAALIARDPSLVGNLLKIANSSFYRVTAEPVESVDRAVVLLGTDGIRSLCTAALMQPIFRIGGADFPRFPDIAWEHTFRAANASVPYNFLVEKSDPAAAELLSLVMGLAGIVVFRVALDQYARQPRLRPDAGVMALLLDTHSASVARQIGTSWELSESTLAGLDGQTTGTSKYPTALGRSLYFGRLVGALAVLRMNHIIDDETGKASIPATDMPEEQLERMWTRLTPKPDNR
jgi:HDOD domain